MVWYHSGEDNASQTLYEAYKRCLTRAGSQEQPKTNLMYYARCKCGNSVELDEKPDFPVVCVECQMAQSRHRMLRNIAQAKVAIKKVKDIVQGPL